MQQFSHSYPPCFRHQFSDQPTDELSDNDNHHTHEQDPLPSIDLHQINLKKLEEACTDWGIFRLVNHGIPSGLLSELHEHAVRMFGLEFESKQKLFESVPLSAMSYFWGTPAITPAGVPLLALCKEKGIVNYNWVEGLNIPLSQPSKVDLVHQPQLRDFRSLSESYGVHLERLAKSIFGAMSQNLELSEDNECYLSPSTGHLRVYRYPRCCFDKQPKVWGMDVHTDSSVVTILNQFEVGGLQVLSPKDTWIDAKPIPNTLIVHLGDMMQAISNDKYKSVKHRVLVNREKERFSMGYFVFPADDCVIRSPNYKPFTYPDFRAQVQQDVKTLGLKVGLSRFKLNVDF